MLSYIVWFMCRNPAITRDEGTELTATLSPGLKHPAGKNLSESVVAAHEYLQVGRRHPEILVALGDWFRELENE